MTRDVYHTSSGSEWADKTSEEKERFIREEWASLKEQTKPARRRFAPLLAPVDFLGQLCKYPFRAALKRLKAWFQTWPLFIVIAFWVTVGLSTLTGLFGLWAYNSATVNSPTGSPQAIKKACFDAADGFVANLQCVWKTAGAGPDTYEAMKLALAVIGGIGGVAFLVIKYRTRVSQERDEARADRRVAEERLLAAVQQLGSDAPQVRIAGVYALADVADTYLGDYKQRVVNILCGYLRTTRGKFVEHEPESGGGRGSTEQPDVKLAYVSHDGSVESTILEVLAAHYRKPDAPQKLSSVNAELSWSDCKIDLHGAHFVELVEFVFCEFKTDLHVHNCHFVREANFDGSTFTGWASFDGSTFKSWASFEGSIFYSVATFKGCNFDLECTFTNCEFRSEASFNGSNFDGWALFVEVAFCNGADFVDCTFKKWARFEHSTLKGIVHFQRSKFESWASFEDLTCLPFIERDDFRLDSIVDFANATFNHHALVSQLAEFSIPLFESFRLAANGLPTGARWDDDPSPKDGSST